MHMPGLQGQGSQRKENNIMHRMNGLCRLLLVLGVGVLLLGHAAYRVVADPAIEGERVAPTPAPVNSTPPRAPFHPPPEEEIPAGPLGDAIRYGQQLLTQTQVYAKAYVGNGLNCTSCHLQAGRMPNASPWVGIWGVFPDYNARSGRIISLQDRINA